MTYAELCIMLLYYKNSPFKMKVWSNFSFSGIFYDLINLLAYGIGYLFKIILDGMNSFAIGAYKFLSFSESSTIRGLYDVLSKYIWIPVLLCGVIACFRVILGQRNVGKQFIRNLCYLFVAVAILPSVFSYINNNVIDENYFTGVSGTDPDNGKSLADDILRTNATDRLWLYDYMAKNEGSALSSLDAKISTMGKIDTISNPIKAFKFIFYRDDYYADAAKTYWAEMLDDSGVSTDELSGIFDDLDDPAVHKAWVDDTSISNHLTFDDGATSINEKMTEKVNNNWRDSASSGDGDGYTDGVPNFFKVKVSAYPQADGDGTQNIYTLEQLSDGTNLLGITGSTYLGKESYWRYDIDWLNVYIELLAHAYVAFVVGYCAVKLIIELIIHQVFGGMMAAMDLSGGDRIKKYFSAIIGCYIGLMIGAMVLPLYTAGCDFITNNLSVKSGFVRAVLEIVLALVIVNVPNIIAMYFGVNTGARAGAFAFMAGAATARGVAKATGKAAEKTGRGISNISQKSHQRSRERLADARFEAGRAERREQNQHSQERERLADQRYEAQQTRNAEQIQHSQERERLADQRNERQDLSDSAGMVNLSDEAHDRPSTFDYDAEGQRQEALNSVSADAEKNGGSRQAYLEAAENNLRASGAFQPTQETIAYTADAAKIQKEQSQINARAAEIINTGNGNVNTQQAQVQASKEVLKDWGASERHIEKVSEHNRRADQLPKTNNNPNLKT